MSMLDRQLNYSAIVSVGDFLETLYPKIDYVKIAKKVFEIMVETGEEPSKIIKEKSLKQQSDPKELEKIIIKVLGNNSDKVSEYKSGKEKLYGFFVGEIMKASSGKANPQLVNDILKNKLKKWQKV